MTDHDELLARAHELRMRLNAYMPMTGHKTDKQWWISAGKESADMLFELGRALEAALAAQPKPGPWPKFCPGCMGEFNADGTFTPAAVGSVTPVAWTQDHTGEWHEAAVDSSRHEDEDKLIAQAYRAGKDVLTGPERVLLEQMKAARAERNAERERAERAEAALRVALAAQPEPLAARLAAIAERAEYAERTDDHGVWETRAAELIDFIKAAAGSATPEEGT